MHESEEIYKDKSYLDKNVGWHEEDSEWKYDHIRKILADTPYKTIVDVGCGAGKILELFHLDFPEKEFHGYDITDNVQHFWKKRNSSIQFHYKNILEENVHFDLLLLIDVFEHVEDYYLFLRKLKGKSTYFVFHIPLDMFALASITRNYKQKKDSVGHLHYYDKDTALGVLQDVGFKIVDYRFTKSYEIANTKRNKKLKILRKITEKVLGVDLNSRIMGGYSLMVLCSNT